MATTFEEILIRLHNLQYDDWDELDKIRPLTYELIKRSFPTDSVSTIYELQAINFKQKPISEVRNSRDDFPIGAWNAALSKFIGIVEAKKETFDLKVKGYIAIKNQNTSQKSMETVIGDLKQKFSEAESAYNEKIQTLITNNRNVTAENTKLKANHRLKTLLSNGLYWTLFGCFIFGFFGIGYYFGNNRFDAEKLSMRDTINSQKNEIMLLKIHPKPTKKG